MALKDLLKKRDKLKGSEVSPKPTPADRPEFTIVRSDTHTQEVINPPSFDSDTVTKLDKTQPGSSKRSSRFRSLSSVSTTSRDSKGEKRHSHFLSRRSYSHDSRTSSVNVPVDLPSIDDDATEGLEEREAQWEERATILAKENPNLRQSTSRDDLATTVREQQLGRAHPRYDSVGQVAAGNISDAKGDDDIQEAIRLHESGDLSRSTAMFGRLADPHGENNALSQVLYGLALRHGWGLPPDPSRAVVYLSHAASNSASIESQALAAGVRKGGAAKGELVLAIYELANCFRHGWGVEKDAVAARSYYETAANLGDTDAMNEAARCYEEGFGGKKDKFIAAKYYRLAEGKGSKTLGNSWIWKDKYNPQELH